MSTPVASFGDGGNPTDERVFCGDATDDVRPPLPAIGDGNRSVIPTANRAVTGEP